MDWAYRMLALHDLDPLGGMIVMHLGWRDAANLRTDRGIAKALNQHRSAVQYATAKLAAAGLIVRRSGQWVACETVAIVQEAVGARVPDASAADVVGPVSGPRVAQSLGRRSVRRVAQSVGRGGPMSGPCVAQSVGHMRIENVDRGVMAAAPSVQAAAMPPLASSEIVRISDLPELDAGTLWRRAEFAASMGQRWRHPISRNWFDADRWSVDGMPCASGADVETGRSAENG